MRRIGTVLILAVGLVTLLMAALVSAAPDSPDANTLTITPIYQGGDTSVKVGEIFTQRVRFERTAASGLLQLEIQVGRPIMFETLMQPTISKSGNVSQNKVFQTDEALNWRGSVNGNGFVQIDIPTRVGDCGKPPQDCPNAIGVRILDTNGATVLSETADVMLAAGDFDRTKIEVVAGIDEPIVLLTQTREMAVSSSISTLSKEGVCLIDCETAVLVMTNNNAVPARVVVRGVAPSGMRWSSTAPPASDDGSARTAEVDSNARVFEFLLDANTTVTRPLNLQLVGNPQDGAKFSLELKACSEQAGNVQCPFDDGLIDLDPLVYESRRRDLADAPDSSNHFAALMEAYSGVQANFPTTADTALVGPHGPVHARPWPLHLGRRVSAESEADVGPDQDAINNIEPGLAIPQANLDRADDGVAINRVSFADCQVTTIPVQVAILPGAVAYFTQNPGKAYVNVWLDGNRDGDWADVGPCNSSAYEHIVIDHPVDVVGLGAGLHTISVTTGMVPWPAADVAKASWMRVTLAEEKSPKLAGKSYGDGRGKGSPYATGETEDYLYYGDEPGSVGFQPDIEITVEEVERGDERRDDLATDGRAPYIKIRPNRELIIQIRNNGFKPSKDLSVKVTLGDVLDQILYDSWTGCLTCTRASEVASSFDTVLRGPNQVEALGGRIRTFNIGTLQPQSVRTIVLGWTGCLTCTREADAISQHTILAKDGNLEWIKKFNRTPDAIASPFIRTAWTGCLTCTRSIEDVSAVQGWDEGVAAIVAKPGQTVKLLKNGVPTGQTVVVGPNGIYVGNLPVQPDEKTVYQAVAVEGGLESEPSNPIDMSCPASGVIILSLDQVDADGKVLSTPRLLPNASFSASDDEIRIIRYLYSEPTSNVTLVGFGQGFNRLVYRECRDQETDLSLNYLGEEIVFPVRKDSGEIHVLGWTGCLTCTRSAESTDVTFTVVATPTGSAQGYEYSSSFEYTPPKSGKISDSKTGLPIEGAEVMVLRKVKKGTGRHTWIEVGDCVTTLKDGSWSALVPAGEYMVVVKKDGYQPYRSDSIWVVVTGELFDNKSPRYELGFNIGMPPSVVTKGEMAEVDISQGRLGDPVMNVEIGMALRFVNNGGADTSVSAELGAGRQAAAGTTIDSGLLASGESFTAQFDEPGTYRYTIAGDESQEGLIVVTGGYDIYLPLIVR